MERSARHPVPRSRADRVHVVESFVGGDKPSTKSGAKPEKKA